MAIKSCACVLLLLGVASAQTPVSLSGTVKSARTGEGIEGAAVKLERSTLATTSTSTGSFQISGVTSVVRETGRPGIRSDSEGTFIVHHQLEHGQVAIRVLDLTGAERAVLHNGNLPKGAWSIHPPAPLGGVRILSIETPRSRRSVRLLAGVGSRRTGSALAISPAASGHSEPIIAGRSQAVAIPDTLQVTRNGFLVKRIGLASLQQAGIEVLLEDSVGADSEVSTIVPDPSWPAYMPDGIPPPSLGTLAFTLTLQIGAIHDVGLTRFGTRRQYDIKGGSVTGDCITATVSTGGLDYDLTLSNGSKEIEQIVILRAGSTPILMRNAGVAPSGTKNARMVLDFEAPNSSSYTWLNTGKFAAVRVVDTLAKTIRMEVYDISKAVLPTARVQVKDPVGAENQSWDCPVQTGGQGASVLTETVTLGSSISIGASKRGSRNIIPITGGTTNGRVVGKILDGGADYQLGGLDARYTLAPNDGELVIVRNCGSGTLYPVFEARVAGPYNFLNQNKYVSSSPGIVGGGVNITFYEKR